MQNGIVSCRLTSSHKKPCKPSTVYGEDPWNILLSVLHRHLDRSRQRLSIQLPSQLALSRLNFDCTIFHAELAAYADGQGITKDGRHVDQMGNQLSQFLPHSCAKFLVCAAAWLRSTEAFKNRKSSAYKIQKTFHKVTRQLSPLTLVMEIAALQPQVCNSVVHGVMSNALCLAQGISLYAEYQLAA